MIADKDTSVDWWIITRDTIFVVMHLSIFSLFLLGNNITLWKTFVLLLLYFVHTMLMKYNHIYEVAIKKSVARSMEIKELKKIATDDITHFHRNLNSRAITLE